MKEKDKVYSIVALKSLRKDMMWRLDGALGTTDDDRIYFRLPTNDDATERANRVHVLAQLGVIMGEDYARNNKLKGHGVSRVKGQADVSCRVFGNGYQSQGYFKPNYWKKHKSFMMSEIVNAIEDKSIKDTNNLVRVTKDRWSRAESNIYGTVFSIVKDRKGLECVKTDTQLFNELGNTEFEVNTSKMLMKDIPTDKTIVYCDFRDKGKELEGFTLEELGLNPKGYYFISPTDKTVKDVKRFKDLISWYCQDKGYKFEASGAGHVKEALARELGISHMSGDTLEKTAGLLRIRREIVEQYPKLYEIVKEAITWASDDNQDTMRELVKAHIQEMKK
jgi:hypothetical protein